MRGVSILTAVGHFSMGDIPNGANVRAKVRLVPVN